MLSIFDNPNTEHVRQQCQELLTIYERNKNVKDFPVEDMVVILNQFTTVNVKVLPLCAKLSYWEFLHEVMDNLEYGYSKAFPLVWPDYMRNDLSCLSHTQICAEYDRFLMHREVIFKKYGIPFKQTVDKFAILGWFQRPQQEQFFLSIVKVLCDYFLYLTTEPVDNSFV